MTLYRGLGGTGSATSDLDTTLYQQFLNQTITASNAAVSAQAAAESAETSAQTSASAAEAASIAAVAAYDSFDDRYLGAKASDPTVDNDGNALLTGALYFNTVNNIMEAYNGSSWVAAYIPASSYLSSTDPVYTGTLTGGTGVVNLGSGQVVKDSSGRVGLGTASPLSLLHLSTNNPEIRWADTDSLGIVQARHTGSAFLITVDPTNVDTSSNFQVAVDGAERLRVDASGNLLPGSDNSSTNGSSARRWSAIWAASGTIQTSDEREKTDIIDSPLGLDFILAQRPVAYKFKIGGNDVTVDEEGKEVVTPRPGQRQHFGLLAQHVKQTIGDTDFGGWIKTDPSDVDSSEGLRYDEFISPLIKAIQEQQEIIKQLTARIETLEVKGQ